MILIDDLIKDEDSVSNETIVTVDGTPYSGWQIAKPMNYEKEFTSKKERKKMADLVMEGKAIAVQYFTDLTVEQQSDYVKAKLGYDNAKSQCSPSCDCKCKCNE